VTHEKMADPNQMRTESTPRVWRIKFKQGKMCVCVCVCVCVDNSPEWGLSVHARVLEYRELHVVQWPRGDVGA
jgi:hypothetical protein